MELRGRVAIVTGGASGVGRAVAEGFAEAGAEAIVIADIQAEAAQEAAQEIARRADCRVEAVPTDVSDQDSVERMARTALDRLGHIDILVNNAGICPVVAWDEVTLESWNRILAVNLTGAFLCTRAVLPAMRRQRYGRIVYVSSLAAVVGSIVGHPAYGASKAGEIALMKVVAKRFASEGILANAICPGTVDTPLTDSFGPEVKAAFAEAVLLKRQARPPEIADAVLFLCSDRASYITGATLHVNGGQLLV